MKKLLRCDYEKILGDLRKCVMDYYDLHLPDTVYTLFLANGEKLYYKVPEGKISHLLGVNTNYLSASGCLQISSTNSIDVLKALIKEENQFSYISKFLGGYLQYEQVFSDFIEKKINIFKENIRINVFQLEFVAKIDRNKCHQNGIDIMKTEYLLCSKTENGEYLVLGLAKEGESYVPITSQSYEDIDEFKSKYASILEGQELTIPTSVFKKTGDSLYVVPLKIYLKPNDKLSKVIDLENYSKEFNANTNITSDYIYTMKNSIHTYKSVENIASFIRTGQNISADDIQYNGITINGATQTLIDSYNDIIASKSGVDNNSLENNSYSSLQKENIRLKNDLIRLKEELEKMGEKYHEVSSINEELQSENNCYRDVMEKTQESFQKVLNGYPKK